MSESDIEVNHTNGHINGDENGHPKQIMRAMSTPFLMNGSSSVLHSNTNGGNYATSRRYTPTSGQKGIMQRFIASKGRLSLTPMNGNNNNNTISAVSTKPVFVSQPLLPPLMSTANLAEGKPIRKGFVPVEEKIQKELKDLKDRENELKRLRKKSSTYQLDFSSLDLSDKESDSESEEDIPMPGKLKAAKSIGELYEAMGDARSPSPLQTSGPDSYGSMKPAKSLAELCDLGPDDTNLAPSSTKLIAQWENLILKKQESGAA